MAEAVLALAGSGSGIGSAVQAMIQFLRMIEHAIIVALRWLKQAIFKIFSAVKSGIRTAVIYEMNVTKELIRFLSRNPDIAWGLSFAILFDFLNVNGD